MPYKDKEQERLHNKLHYEKNKATISEKHKEYYKANREETIERTRKYYENNKDAVRIRSAKYYQKHKKYVTERQNIWVKNNRDKVRIIKKNWKLRHKEQYEASEKKRRLKNKNHTNELKRIWRKNNPEKVKSEKLWLRFKLTLKDYREILNKQNNKCGICGKEFDEESTPNGLRYPCIDHCHKSKQVRGILCRGCNSGIGGFKDNSIFLLNALQWVTRKEYGILFQNLLPRRNRNKKAEFKKILEDQSGNCGICKRKLTFETRFELDHSHSNQKVRGLLCGRCNRALGLLKDNPTIIQNAINWLDKPHYQREIK